MQTCTVDIPAKINLILHISGSYPDGYHRLDMLNTTVAIYDTVAVRESNTVWAEMDGKACDERNTALRALRAVQEKYGKTFCAHIVKRIPMCAGLGGSSADASAVLLAVNRWLHRPMSELEEIALGIGADCPYMLHGGYMRVRGKGEELTPVSDMPRLHLVIAQNAIGGTTGQVYGAYDADPCAPRQSWEQAATRIRNGQDGTDNVLTRAAVKLCPQIGDAIEHMRQFTPIAWMTGSGSAVVGVFADEAFARRAQENWKLDGTCIVTQTCDGARITVSEK